MVSDLTKSTIKVTFKLEEKVSTKTINDVLHKFKPMQLDYMLAAIQQWSYIDRENLHRGLLPFISTIEAAACMRQQLHFLTARVDANPDASPIIGQRFIKQILSILGEPEVPAE